MVLVPQVLLEVEAVHELIDETEGVCLGRVRPHQRYYIHVSVAKEAAYPDLVTIPLLDVISVPMRWVTVAAYPCNLNNVERRVATVGFQYDLAAVVYRPQGISEPPSSNWVTTDERDALRAEPRAGRLYE